MRLITRGDSDGLACAVLLSTVLNIDDIRFAHPKDMQDGIVEVSDHDVIANLPYHPNCGLWFDHHITSEEYIHKYEFKGNFELAPSAARAIYNYYVADHPEIKKYDEFINATDKIDSAQLSVDEVNNPQGFIKLFFTLDPRSGLGRFMEYFLELIDKVKEKSIDEILEDPEVKKRCDKMMADQEEFKTLLKEHSYKEDNVIIIDFRNLKDIPSGNRFLEYTLYPECNVSVRIFDGKKGEFIVCAVGHSIFNRTCRSDIGQLLREFGGGGHTGAGTCQIPLAEQGDKIPEIINLLKEDSEEDDIF